MSEQLNPSSGSRCGQFPGLELEINVMNLERIYGIGRLAAMLLTFEDAVTDAKEASKRFNSLNSNFLAERYPVRVAVLERTKADRVHFHLLVVCPVDIRSGFDFDAVKRRDYMTACPWLRSEWALFRRSLEKYGFGRIHELLPIKTDAGTVGRYFGKYLGKSFNIRRELDRGIRRVRYSTDFPRAVVGRFCSVAHRAYRLRCGAFARFWGLKTEAELERKFGRRWRWTFRELLSPSQTPGTLFAEIMMHARESLTYFDGLEFAILKALEHAKTAPEHAA